MLCTVNERVITYLLTTITKPPEVVVDEFCFVSVSVSFFLLPCSKGQVLRAYLDTILMTLVYRRSFLCPDVLHPATTN